MLAMTFHLYSEKQYLLFRGIQLAACLFLLLAGSPINSPNSIHCRVYVLILVHNNSVCSP